MDCLSEIDDPRKPSHGTLHDFQEILLIAIAAMLSDCDTVEDFACWGRAKASWLRQFLVLKNGIPSEDTFLRIFRLLDPKTFETAFRRWVGHVARALHGTLAVDGKTVRGSATGGESAIHLVSDLGVVLGQEKVAGKSNEISAIETAFISHAMTDGVDRQGHPEKPHGRIVGQVASVLPAKGTVDPADWPKCRTIGRIDSIRVVGGQESGLAQRYYISSRELTAAELTHAVRAHWGIENRLHWVLDVSFGEDSKTLRKDNAPQNLSLLRKIVLNLIRLAPPGTRKTSLRLRRKAAAWDDDQSMNMLGLSPL